ncbi:unnamed protein product [Somion occarium]|uniref:N-acetyltransferase domain-containing protein n=2 Tax=Somion occarium TaxID=3059160 RepID=A0ABP1E1F6_9APHY
MYVLYRTAPLRSTCSQLLPSSSDSGRYNIEGATSNIWCTVLNMNGSNDRGSLLEGFHIEPTTVEQTIALRHAVLWPHKPESHVRLPEDDSGYHFGAFVSSCDAPIAVISVFKEPLPPVIDSEQDEASISEAKPPFEAGRFRKFACDSVYQGHGVGTALLRHVFSAARDQLGCCVLWCDARLSTSNWYERRGMQIFGPVFTKSGVGYIRMKATL